MTWSDYDAYDATGLADLVRHKDVSCRELVEEAVRRIEESDPQVNAVNHRCVEDALRLADAGPPDGPYRGVPFLVKDELVVEGQPATFGSAAFRALGGVAPHDSNVARRFRAAGLVVLGRTNQSELGLTYTCEPTAFGPTRNPWDLTRSAGGSSGGSAAAVAAGYLPAAHAHDGGGSARIPASATGLVGLKPSRGRISHGPDESEGVAGLGAHTVLTRTVRDTAGMLDVLAGYLPGDPYTAPATARPFRELLGEPLGSLRVGVMHRMPGFDVDPVCRQASERVAGLLAGAGHVVDDAWPAAFEDYRTAVLPHLLAQFSAAIAAIVADLDAAGTPLDLDLLEPGTREHVERGRAAGATSYLHSRAVTSRFARSVLQWWHDDGGYDLLVTPTLAVPPPPLGHLDDDGSGLDGVHRRMFAMCPSAAAFNITGQPAISLPLHRSPEGLSVGVQLVAAYGREDLLLQVAAYLERASPWHEHRAGAVPGHAGEPTDTSQEAPLTTVF